MNRIYLRVSTEDSQEFDRQIYILEKSGYVLSDCIVYQEKISGKSTKKRDELKRLLNEVEPNDTVVITEISRLARSVMDLWKIANEIVACEANLISIKESIDLKTAAGRLMFTMLGGVAQFEADVISERTIDALNAKKKSGVRLGRPKSISDEVMTNAINTYINTNLSYDKVGEMYNISGVSIFNEVKRLNKIGVTCEKQV